MKFFAAVAAIALCFALSASAQTAVLPPPSSPMMDTWSSVLVSVILNDNSGQQATIQTFLSLWGSYFPNVVFYGPVSVDPADENPAVAVTTHAPGNQNHRCLANTISNYGTFAGYFLTNIDTFLNLQSLTASFSFGSLWAPNGIVAGNENWSGRTAALAALAAAYNDNERPFTFASGLLVDCAKLVDSSASSASQNAGFIRGGARVMYVPSQYADTFVKLSQWATRNNLPDEIAGACIMHCWIPHTQASTSTNLFASIVNGFRLASLPPAATTADACSFDAAFPVNAGSDLATNLASAAC